MLAKIAAVIALLLTVLSAPVSNPQPEPAGYPEPATAVPYTVGDAPEPPTATPVTLPTPAATLFPTAQPGYQLICLHITKTELAGGGVYAECAEYGYAPIAPLATPLPEGYPNP